MIIPYVMFESGPIPGLEGIYAGGQVVYVDTETNTVTSAAPIVQQPHNTPRYSTQPLVAEQPAADESALPPDNTDGGQQ